LVKPLLLVNESTSKFIFYVRAALGSVLTALQRALLVTRKPLFAVSVADIGLEPGEVERILADCLTLGAYGERCCYCESTYPLPRPGLGSDTKRVQQR
jgi:hypothetical protein